MKNTFIWTFILMAFASTASAQTQLFPNDFSAVCSGAGIAGATPYAKTPGKTHPILIFSRTGANEKFMEVSTKSPPGWRPDWKEVTKTELVACVTAVERKAVKECPFDIQGTKFLVRTQDTKYDVVIAEAQTGKVIEKTQWDLKASDKCPMVHFFKEKEESVDADYKESFIQLAKPHVQP